MTDTATALQVRLILEQQCATIGRALAADSPGSFALWLFDYGPRGNFAFCAQGTPASIRGAVERFLREGCVPLVVASAEAAPALHASADALGDDLRARCPAGVGFALLMLNAAGEPQAYLSSAERTSVRRMLTVWLLVDAGR